MRLCKLTDVLAMYFYALLSDGVRRVVAGFGSYALRVTVWMLRPWHVAGL